MCWAAHNFNISIGHMIYTQDRFSTVLDQKWCDSSNMSQNFQKLWLWPILANAWWSFGLLCKKKQIVMGVYWIEQKIWHCAALFITLSRSHRVSQLYTYCFDIFSPIFRMYTQLWWRFMLKIVLSTSLSWSTGNMWAELMIQLKPFKFMVDSTLWQYTTITTIKQTRRFKYGQGNQ